MKNIRLLCKFYQKTKKQFFSFLMAMVMLISAFPMTIVFAENSTPRFPVDLTLSRWEAHTYTGGHDNGSYSAIDITLNKSGAQSVGKAVYAVEDGTITNIDSDNGEITIKHIKPLVTTDGYMFTTWYSTYAHMKDEPKSKKPVKKGEKIGNIDKVGNATGYHLHFQISSADIWGNGAKAYQISPYYVAWSGATSSNLYWGIGGTQNPAGNEKLRDWTPAKVIGAVRYSISNPTAPTVVSRSAVNIAAGDSVNISWSGATGTIDGYKVSMLDASNSSVIKTVTITANKTDTSFDLPTSGTYKFSVKAYNSAGDSDGTGMSENITVYAPFAVTFKDWDGKDISTQSIGYGKNATLPKNPSRDGYDFLGWSGSYTNVTSTRIIIATYNRFSYTVTFFNKDGGTHDIKVVYHGGTVTAPSTNPMPPPGYTFEKWDKSLSDIKSNMTIKPVFLWADNTIPVVATIASAERNSNQTGYNVMVNLTNYPTKSTQGIIIATLKSTEGKMLASQTQTIDLSANKNISENIFINYTGMASSIEINVVDINDEDKDGVPIAVAVKKAINLGLDWTNWSTIKPAQTGITIESRTEYRSTVKETKTNTSNTLNGWTYSNETTASQTGAWSDWSTTQYYESASTGVNMTTSRVVETRQVKERTQYRYMHYKNYSNGNTSPYLYSGYNATPHYTAWLDSALPQDGMSSAGVAKYRGSCSTCGISTYFYLPETRDINRTEWRYRDDSVTTTYHFWRWDDTKWTDWSPIAISETADKKVETRTTYRYKTSVLIEDKSGESRNISGTLGGNFANKKATLMIYKHRNKRGLESQLQYVEQVTLDVNGKYSFALKTKEEPTKDTGDFIVLLGVQGASASMYIDTIPAPVPKYNVVFVDDENNILSTQTVEQGGEAVAPAEPIKDGYRFIAWDTALKNINADLTVKSYYIPNQYSVIYLDWDNKLIDVVEYEHGEVLSAPLFQSKDGDKTFTGWDVVIDGRTTATKSMIVRAQYKVNKYTVVFENWDGTELKRQTVSHGEKVSAPNVMPIREGMIFSGWHDAWETEYVTKNLIIYPEFEYLATAEVPVASVEAGIYSNAQTITLSSNTKNAKIYYISIPINTNDEGYGEIEEPFEYDENGKIINATLYTAPIDIENSQALVFQAFAEGMNDSYLIVESYEITSSPTLKITENTLVRKSETDSITGNIHYNITNEGDIVQNAEVIMAIYDINGKLVYIQKSKPETITVGDNYGSFENVNVSNMTSTTEYTVKLFLWSLSDSMKPLSSPTIFTL